MRRILETFRYSRWFSTIWSSAFKIYVSWRCHDMETLYALTHWGRVTHICVGKPAIIGSDNGLSPDRRQAIIWTNAGILLIGPLGTYFSEILTGIQTFSFKKMHLKISSAKWCSFCLGLNELMALCEGSTSHRWIPSTKGQWWWAFMHTMDMLWEKFQWILPLYMKPISF